MPGNVLIADDEEQLRKLLVRIISLEGFHVSEAQSLKAASQVLRSESIDVLLCDVRLPDGSGVDFVKSVRQLYPAIEIILLTAYGNIADGVQAIKNGAFDYIIKGNDNDRIIPLLHLAMEKAAQQKKSAIVISSHAGDFNHIIGKSPAIVHAVKLAQKIAATDSTVLLLGETGTGKEVFANAIHHAGKRKNKPLIAINCSTLGSELLENELFGHKAGAFTGALKEKKGLIEVADGGTLFLDEIGELSPGLQSKLLRVLENGEFIKQGDTKVSTADVRIIAATNRDLKKEIEEGHFREDLFYRLNIFAIELPSLRDRAEDIPDMANHFLQQFAAKEGRQIFSIHPDAMKLLLQYEWRGNIRELKNVLERASVLADDEMIVAAHLPHQLQSRHSSNENPISLASVEAFHIRKILQHTGGNKTKAARLLEIGLATLYRKLEEYGIEPRVSK
jgi:two-component system NtrC family response regulator